MEKPLHVRVAEALGCTPRYRADFARKWWECGCDPVNGLPPHVVQGDWTLDRTLASYDTDWSATGPLIRRLGLSLNFYVCDPDCCHPDGVRWTAAYGSLGIEFPDASATARAPLVAVCNLILALKEAGKLEPETTSAR